MNQTKHMESSAAQDADKKTAGKQKPQIEVCAGSYADCLAAHKAGIRRVELNSALSVGGLTPSTATLNKVKELPGLEVICMVRPRAAGFCYDELETEVMMAEAQDLLEHGADGIAFGFLDEKGQVDRVKTQAMVDLIHRFHKTAVFHRAIDVVSDWEEAMETLAEMGVDRILTSGQQAKAEQGIAVIAAMQDRFGDRIEILAGSGINAGNAQKILEETGIHQVHSSCKAYRQDPTTRKGPVSYGYLPDEYAYDVVSKDLAQELAHALGY